MESILDEWVNFAKTIFTSSRKKNIKELQDDAKKMLVEIAADIEYAQSDLEQAVKSKGLDKVGQDVKESAAWNHGFIRMKQGFNINEIVSEYRALRASVTKLWVDASNIIQPSAFNDLIRFNEGIDQALFESVTSFSSAKEHQARRFETMLSSSPDLCYILDLDGKFLYVNRAMIELYKKPVHDILGKSRYNSAMPSKFDVHVNIQHIIDTGERCYGEVEFQAPSGKQSFFEYVFEPLFDENGKLEAIAATSHDITTHKKNEKKN